MENYDALSVGVEPGGLRNKGEIKTLVCYLVNTLEEPVTKRQLIEVVTQEGIANYFEITQALDEVIGNGSVGTGDGGVLYITQAGKNTISAIEHDVPFAVREQAYNAVVMLQLRLRREREHKIDIIAVNNGYNVTMSVLDGEDELMKISVFAADYEQALSVKEKFLSDPATVYSNIITLLME